MTFIIGDWNAKVGSQEITGVKGKFGLGVQNEAGQRLTGFGKRMPRSQQTPSSTMLKTNLHTHIQLVNAEIRLTICFAAEDGEALNNQQQQQQQKTGNWLWLRS